MQCLALCQPIRVEAWTDNARTTERGLDWSKLARDIESFSFSAEEEQVQAFDRRSALRASLLSMWKVDTSSTEDV